MEEVHGAHQAGHRRHQGAGQAEGLTLLRRLVLLVGALGALSVVAAALVVANDARGRSDVHTSSQGPSSAAALPAGVHPLSDKKPASGPVPGAVPTRWRGPQGRTGQFVVHCSYSHSGQNDPIVHYAMTGMSHRHDFYGAEGTDADTTPDSMLADDTTCDKTADRAAYWQPTLYDHGEIVEPEDMSAYYRAAPGVDPRDVQPFPLGLALIAGDQFATHPQEGEAAGWTCGVRTDLSVEPPECEPSAPLHLVLTFPDCWDGTYLDSADHVSHASYSDDGTCPKGFPVHVPQLTMSIRFPISGPGHDLTLASGDIVTAHGDFFNGWVPAGLAREVDACIHRGVVCDLASNREEEALFAYTK